MIEEVLYLISLEDQPIPMNILQGGAPPPVISVLVYNPHQV